MIDFSWWRGALIVITLIAGAIAVMWLGELITARGIGNGMSILIFISIISGLPSGIDKLITHELRSQIILFVVIALAVIVAVIWITSGERRIPVQYAKRVVGRRMMGGHEHVHPAQGQHGRRHPGHLRLVGHADPDDLRAVHRQRPNNWFVQLVRPEQLRLPRR